MSFLWTLMDEGNVAPFAPKGFRQRLLFRFGKYLATRSGKVAVGEGTLIHPGSHVCTRGSSIKIGEDCRGALGAAVQGNVSIGDHSSVQAYTLIVGYGKEQQDAGAITIGDYVRIAGHCMIISANHVFSNPDIPIHEQGMNNASITIEDDVWIGGNVNITAGVTIGTGSVIGGGSVVTKDIPPYSIAVGSPAKVIKKRK